MSLGINLKSPMHYELAGWTGAERAAIPLEKHEFEQIRDAKGRLIDVLRIEEKYNMLLENYQDFEKSLLDATLSHILFAEPIWESLVATGYQTARRLQNVLSMARVYIDQVQHDLNAIYGLGSANRTAFEQWTNEEYDRKLGYRAMEALRNFMQHRSLPVQGLSIGGEHRELAIGAVNVYTIKPKLDVSALRDQGGFKAKVLAELEQLGEEVPLKPLVRGYLEGLANVHYRLRTLLAADILAWKGVLDAATQRFVSAYPANPQHISIVAKNDDSAADSEDVFADFVRRLHWLQTKNSKARRLSKQVISSE